MAAFNTQDNVNYGIQIGQSEAPVTLSLGSSETSHQACLRALRVTDPRSDKTRIEETGGGLLKDSYSWILENDQFKRWIENHTSCLLWIKGDPGKGKTMLLCGIVEELTQLNRKDSNISFFFCQATDIRINNATAVLRGLIFLLVDQTPSLLYHVQAQYDKAGKALFEGPNAWSALSVIFRDMLKDPSLKNTYLIIDALDECITGREFLLDMIAQESSAHSQIKWIVSSRNWLEIEERLSVSSCISPISLELNDSCVPEAVKIFVQRKVASLTKMKRYTDKTRDTVCRYLLSNSRGTFLWVALGCQNLDRTPSRNAIKKLEAFPPGLSSLYDRMFDQVYQSDDATLCKQILAVMSTVHRPITLSELNTLIEESVDDDLDVLSEIIADCGSFLTFQKTTATSVHDTVTFVHQSAKDFLLQERLSEILPQGIEAENKMILIRSLEAMSKTLRRDMFGLKLPGYPIHRVEPPSPNPLAAVTYGCIYWVDHFGDSQHSESHGLGTEEKSIVETFLQQKYLYWLEALSLLRCVSYGVQAMKKLEIITKVFEGHSRSVNSCTWSPDGFRLASASSDKTIRIWDLATSQTESKPEGHSNAVHSLEWSPCGSRLASSSSDGTTRIWDPTTGQSIQTLKGAGPVAWFPDKSSPILVADYHLVGVWDVMTGQLLSTLDGHTERIMSMTWSPDGSRLASASFDKTIHIWDPATTSKSVHVLSGHTGAVTYISWSPDGNRLASTSFDETIRIWNPTATSQSVQVLEGSINTQISLAWSPDQSRIASTSFENNIKICNLNTGRIAWVLEMDTPAHSISWSLDGSRLASSNAERAMIWNTDTRTCVPTIRFNDPLTVEFDKTHRDHLHTSAGTYDIGSIGQVGSLALRQLGYGLNDDFSWISHDGVNLIWLPAEYRPVVFHNLFLSSAGNLAICCPYNRIIFLAVGNPELEHGPSVRLPVRV